MFPHTEIISENHFETTHLTVKNNRLFVKYVSENMTFIMCFWFTCNVFRVGAGSKGDSTGVRIVKRASKNYCIFWDQKIAARIIIMIIIVVRKEAATSYVLYNIKYVHTTWE